MTPAFPTMRRSNAIWPEWFKGTIDEVRVWNAARSASEILADSKSPV